MNPTQSEHREPQLFGRERAAGDLRAWAAGCLATEAAVELLIAACHGRFAEPGWPWLPSDRRGIWLDATQIADATGGLSVGEARILSVVESLAIGAPLDDLAGLLAGLDPRSLALVLAAFRHAGGGREPVPDWVSGDQRSQERPTAEHRPRCDAL